MLVCITCESVVLLTAKPGILRKERTLDLLLPTVSVSCEKDERRKVGFEQSAIGSATALWTSLSISCSMIRLALEAQHGSFPSDLTNI